MSGVNNKYGKAAVECAKILAAEKDSNPKSVWESVTKKIFGKETSSQKKGCPRNAFLGLCEEGLVKGVPPGNYTKSKLNKRYAVKAVDVLARNPDIRFTPESLWDKIVKGKKAHNHQMDVVLALWNNNLIEVENIQISNEERDRLREEYTKYKKRQKQVSKDLDDLDRATTYSFSGIPFVKVDKIELERDSEGNIIEYFPQSRYKNIKNLKLHKYGEGPFCKFQISNSWMWKSGVYIFLVDNDPKYVGECINLASRINMGYGNISPRNCYEGGQRTNCKINHLVLKAIKNKSTVTLLFHETESGSQVEKYLLKELEPEWNGAYPTT